MNKIPNWVLRHKRRGTQITRIGNRFYLYKISSRWDPQKKRAVKVTEEYLGKITKDCVIPPKYKRVEDQYRQISVKEYGTSYFLQKISRDIITELKDIFGKEWKELFSLAVFRLTEKSPLKRIGFYYQNSYLSETIEDVRTSQKFLGPFLRNIGIQRESIKKFMRRFMIDTDYAIIDLTHIFSYSEGVISAMLGHNKDNTYLPQVHLILIYSMDKLQPVYFRQVPGSISDVSTIAKTTNETFGEKFVLIGDKGFYSEKNVHELKENGIDYVLALKRDNSLIDYGIIKEGNINKSDGYFIYNKRQIWFYSKKVNGNNIITFLDPSLKALEESDLAMRISYLEKKSEENKLSEQEQEQFKKCNTRLHETYFRNGTLSVITNIGKTAEEIYQIMKSRVNVEQVFDTFKNVLDADRTYMRDDYQMEGWLFVNFIAMQLYYKIYALLLKNKMLNNYSPLDVLISLKRVYMIKAKDKWQLAEIPRKSKDMIKKLGIDIPIT